MSNVLMLDVVLFVMVKLMEDCRIVLIGGVGFIGYYFVFKFVV